MIIYKKEIDNIKVYRMIEDHNIPQKYFANKLRVKGKPRAAAQINRCLRAGVGKSLLEKITISLISYMHRKYGAKELNLRYFYKD